MKRLGFALEIVLLYGLLGGLGWLRDPAAWSFPGVALHPFLLVVALEATLYGLRPALLAAGLGAALYLMGAPALGSADAVPLLAILATAVLLGLAQESRHRLVREARAEAERLQLEQDRLRQRIAVLEQANQELSERIIGEVHTVASFADLARRLSVLEREDLYPAICDLVHDYLSATRSSLYLIVEGELQLQCARGFAVVPEALQHLTDRDSLAWLAAREGAVLTALDRWQRQGGGGAPVLREGEHLILMAAPLKDPSSDQVIGVICVHALPFSRFHGASKKIFGVIARWAGDALQNAARMEELRQGAASP